MEQTTDKQQELHIKCKITRPQERTMFQDHRKQREQTLAEHGFLRSIVEGSGKRARI